MITAPGVFLRRPLSVFDAEGPRLSFLYKVIGRGTQGLASMKPGDRLEILGPLGTGYAIDTRAAGTVPLIVAGGTGIASVHFLARRLPRPGVLFYGARASKDLLCLPAFRALGWNLCLATDDGSRGHRGVVTDVFGDYLASAVPSRLAVYACGPKPMLDIVGRLAREQGISCQISLEEMMACGVGNCQGCAVKIGDAFKMVCKDGPVFTL